MHLGRVVRAGQIEVRDRDRERQITQSAVGAAQASLPATAFTNATNFPGLVTNNQTTANSLLYFLSGSVATATQLSFIQSPDHQNKWLTYADVKRKINEPHQNEFSLFFKDDWKLRPSLTLNMGLRYEWYGVPYEGQGLSIVPTNGGGLALFGVSGRSFDRWMRPDNPIDLNLVTTSIRAHTPSSRIKPFTRMTGRFSPAVGFAWQLPGSVKAKRTSSGYQVSWGAATLVNQQFHLCHAGFTNTAVTQDGGCSSYFDTQRTCRAYPHRQIRANAASIKADGNGQRSIRTRDCTFRTSVVRTLGNTEPVADVPI
jgi:outer membrane receptor protein involved in Fe transport